RALAAGLSSIDRDQKSIYVQQWNFDIQRTLPGDVVIDAAYAGSKGTHLIQGLQYNQLPDQYLSLGNKLIQRVPNPFLGKIPATQALGGPLVAYGQLLRPYPQFNGFATVGSTSGSSLYHSLQMRVEKRFSHGFSALLSYTNGKLIDDGAPNRISFFGPVPNFQDNNNRQPERSISSQEISQRLSLAYTLELPFGPGKVFFSGSNPVLSRLASGWQINGIHSFQTGIPLALVTGVNNTSSFGGGSRPNSTGKSAKLSGPVSQRLDRYFDVNQFTLPDAYTFGNVSLTLPDVRSPGLVDFDFSLIKNTQIHERFKLQFRAEAFNAFNNTNFGAPGQSAGSKGFGVISSAGDARILQLALKLIF
ncbi:MAG: carboxypeptidase regulatory-like domain-containing protein, partial [Acidobacteria bacterium]|nr:carboxypeptidase regulatory-like domain-containing protein [Acidobacteriota bacterium]